MTSPGQKLRDLIAGDDIVVMPGVYDGISARLVERMGFKAASITGAGLSESVLGWADVGLLGFEDNVGRCRNIAAAVGIPLRADGDTGYGNAVNVYFATRGFEAAGLAGIMYEDQVSPKRCGHMEGKSVIPTEEAVEKIAAAVEARRDPSFVIKARTDAIAVHGLADAIDRLNRYAEAGADLLFADALRAKEDIATVARNVSKPLAVNMGFGIRKRSTTPLVSAKELQDLGVRLVTYPRMLTAAAIQGMKNALEVLATSVTEGRVIERPDLLVSFEEINEMAGLGFITELQTRFTGPKQ